MHIVMDGDSDGDDLMRVSRSFSGSGGGEHSHVADTASVASLKSDEALLSPGGSPGVLDPPVALTGADEGDTVVEAGAAVAEDAVLVAGPVGGIDGN